MFKYSKTPHWYSSSTRLTDNVSTVSSSLPTLVFFNFKQDDFNCSDCCIVFKTSCEIKTPHGFILSLWLLALLFTKTSDCCFINFRDTLKNRVKDIGQIGEGIGPNPIFDTKERGILTLFAKLSSSSIFSSGLSEFFLHLQSLVWYNSFWMIEILFKQKLKRTMKCSVSDILTLLNMKAVGWRY